MRLTARSGVRLAAATVLVAAAGTVLPLSPAAAETCSSDTGVSVVVDATGLGGAISTSCVPDGGGDDAASLFEVHHDLTRAARFPGAVCRVDGAPADAECQNMPPADAYWGLFWSDGSGGWVYSSEGVDSLDVPDGGSVAFAWQDGGDQDAPGVAPPQTAEEPSSSPSPQPTAQPGGGSGGSGGGTGSTNGSGGSTTAPSGSPTASATSSAGPGDEETGGGKAGADQTTKKGKDGKGDRKRRDRGDDRTADPSESPSPTTEEATAAEPPAAADDDGLPAWVAPAGIAGLFGVARVVALLRRRAMS